MLYEMRFNANFYKLQAEGDIIQVNDNDIMHILQ
jgi:hypothetical protein